MTLSLGGVTVGLAILVYVAVRWFQRSRGRWLALLPFLLSAAYGMLLILSTGGILGGAADVALWGSNVVGDSALEYGVGGGTPEVTRTHTLALTDGGHAMVLVISAGLGAYWQFGKKAPKRDMALGALCGVSLGLASGVAGWAADVLAPVVNSGGDSIMGVL